MSRASLVTMLTLLLFTPSAAASEVQLRGGCYREDCTFRADFTADPGETNRLTVERRAPNVIVFRDAAAPIRAGRECVLEGDAAVCTGSASVRYDVHAALGDGDDTAVVADGTIDGGPGDDTLTGYVATGGPGRDTVKAYYVTDGDGARSEADQYEGTSLLYTGRKRAIRIDLRGGRAGEDTLVGFKDAVGGDGDDVLIGTDGANELRGDLGDDRIVALGGKDKIEANFGDRIDAGAGNDWIELGTVGAQHLRCGAGTDLVENLVPAHFVAGDCERVGIDIEIARLRASLTSPDAALLTMSECRCTRSRFVVYHGRETIGSARGRFHRIVLRLNARGRSLLARERRLAVRVEVHDGTDIDEGFRTVLRLR